MRIPVSYDAGNVETLSFEEDGAPFDFNANGVTRVLISACNQRSSAATESEYEISSDTDDVTYNGEDLKVKFGKLKLPKGLYEATITCFSSQNPDGVVICGPGRPANIVLQASC